MKNVKNYCMDCFDNSFKSFWGKLLLFLLLIVIYLFSRTREITLSQELLFGTFSTIMQSFVALGALLGMAAFFRLQVVNNNVENLSLDLRKAIIEFRGGTLGETSLALAEDILKEGNKILKEGEKNAGFSQIKREIPQLEKLFNEGGGINKEIIDFVKSIVLIIIFASGFLIFTPLIIKSYFGTVSLGVILYLVIPSLIATIKLIKEIL